jgi:hypothetical protein
MGEEITVRHVEGQIILVGEANMNAGSDVARSSDDDSAAGVDRRRNTGVRRTENPAMIFDGSHPDHVEVLPRSAGVSIPSVVGDVDEDLRSLLREATNLITED